VQRGVAGEGGEKLGTSLFWRDEQLQCQVKESSLRLIFTNLDCISV